MQDPAFDAGWQGYALSGRPDFLNYLRRGDVTWEQLWDFYHANPADPDAMIRLMGLFHMFQSADYDGEGSVLDTDGKVYPRLRAWARMAVASQAFLPEEKLRESLARLLAQSLISPLYYEAAFGVYLEALLEHQAPASPPALAESVPWSRAEFIERYERRLALRLPERPRPELEAGGRWHQAVTAAVRDHYPAWEHAYALALGEESDDWVDEGISG